MNARLFFSTRAITTRYQSLAPVYALRPMQCAPTKCDGCGSESPVNKCPGCDTMYCGRSCQVKRWRIHRELCVSGRASQVSRLGTLVAGNVLIMAANQYNESGLGAIFVEVCETLHDVVTSDADIVHFAHLTFVGSDAWHEYARATHELSLVAPGPITEDNILIVYVLRDYHAVVLAPHNANLAEIRGRHTCSAEWSVIFRVCN